MRVQCTASYCLHQPCLHSAYFYKSSSGMFIIHYAGCVNIDKRSLQRRRLDPRPYTGQPSYYNENKLPGSYYVYHKTCVNIMGIQWHATREIRTVCILGIGALNLKKKGST
uniref:Uncharacterized protein n=1 Tax=Cacopsylla melanoneura TaxID=428564 RepID=A0A8D9A0M6_9HEMI